MKNMIGALFALVAVFLIILGLHNIDLSVNMKFGALDINWYGYVQDSTTMYLNGFQMIIFGVFFLIGSATIFLSDPAK